MPPDHNTHDAGEHASLPGQIPLSSCGQHGPSGSMWMHLGVNFDHRQGAERLKHVVDHVQSHQGTKAVLPRCKQHCTAQRTVWHNHAQYNRGQKVRTTLPDHEHLAFRSEKMIMQGGSLSGDCCTTDLKTFTVADPRAPATIHTRPPSVSTMGPLTSWNSA